MKKSSLNLYTICFIVFLPLNILSSSLSIYCVFKRFHTIGAECLLSFLCFADALILTEYSFRNTDNTHIPLKICIIYWGFISVSIFLMHLVEPPFWSLVFLSPYAGFDFWGSIGRMVFKVISVLEFCSLIYRKLFVR